MAGDLPDADTADGGDDGGADDGGGAGVCVPPRDLVSMVVQPRFELQQSGTRFALLMVTPRVPRVDAGPRSLFQDLAIQTAPIVDVQMKYVEDPSLGYQCEDKAGAHMSYAQFEPGAFLTRNDLVANFGALASADPIARHVSGDPTTHDRMTATKTVRIPSSDCPSSGCGCRLAGRARSLGGPALLAAVTLLLIRRRRK